MTFLKNYVLKFRDVFVSGAYWELGAVLGAAILGAGKATSGPSVAWQGHTRPSQATAGHLCGLAKPYQAPLWPGKATSGPSVAWQNHIRPLAGPEGLRQASRRPVLARIRPGRESGRGGCG